MATYEERNGNGRTRKARPLYERKRVKREEAWTRQSDYDSLTTEQKIERALAKPGKCAKELARLGYVH